MVIKRLFFYFLSIIGFFLVISPIFRILETALILGFQISPSPDLSATFSYVHLPFYVIALYAGIKSYRDKNIFYKILKPNRHNLTLAALLSVLVLAFFSGEYLFINSIRTLKDPIYHPLQIAFIRIISYFILFYPFAALSYFIFRNRKSKLFKKNKKNLGTIVILLVLLNPIFVVFSFAITQIYDFEAYYEPCGVGYSGFLPFSPSKDAGMRPEDIIIKIDDTEIKTVYDLGEYLNKTTEKQIMITTDKARKYVLTPFYNETLKRYMIGIAYPQTIICQKNANRPFSTSSHNE